MSCIITYKNKRYSEEQFKEYFINNKSEFETSIVKNKEVIDSFKRRIEGIDSVFKDSPELASIGSKTQYMQYLSTIFKTSKVKDIVYHGSPTRNILKFDKSLLGKNVEADSTQFGFYFTENKKSAEIYSNWGSVEKNGKVYPILLNIKNPFIGTEIDTIRDKEGNVIKTTEDNRAEQIKNAIKNNNDSVILSENGISKDIVLVFEPEQIHILSSKADIQGFKEFVKSKESSKISDTGTTRDTEILNNVWNNVSNEDNALISQQFEHIEASKSQKQTCEKIMSFQNDLGGTTDKNYILKNNTVLNRTSSVIDKDPKFKFENEDFDEEEYDINRQWGNQIDDVLRAVILYRFDKDQEAKVLEEIKKQREKRSKEREAKGKNAEESVMSDTVVYKLISEFNKFAKRNDDKILIPQAFLYNEDAKIGGTADIIMINKFGNVQVVDLKSSLYPVGWNGKFFESYDKEGEDGKTYRNSYVKEFGDRGSKKQRHEAQTSMYIGMMLARGINYNESTPIQILPVHIKELEEYSEEMIEDVVVERDDAPMDLNNDYLQKVSIDDKHNDRILNNYETEFDQNKNKLIVFVKNEIELLRRIPGRKSTQRISDLKEMLEKLEDIHVANASKLSYYINDLHKIFTSGKNSMEVQIKNLTLQLKNGNNKTTMENLKELLDYKEKILLFTPLVISLKKFYNEISDENINKNNPDSMLYKLEELISSFDNIEKNYYIKTINPLISEVYSRFASPDKSNNQVKEMTARWKKSVNSLKIRAEELKGKTGIIATAKLIAINAKITKFENDIYAAENNNIITKESILKQLNEGSYEDIGFFQKWTLAPQSSSNVFVAGTGIIIDEIFDNIRMDLIEVQEDIHEAFEEFAKANKDKNRNNPKEFNEGLFETITTGYIKDNQLITVDDVAFIQKTDISKYNKDLQLFLDSIKDIEGEKYWEERSKWYAEHTQGLSMEDEIVNGIIIREGINSIVKDKLKDIENNIISQYQFDTWYEKSFNFKKEGGKVVISGVKFDTKEGRQLRIPSYDKYTNPKWIELQKDSSKVSYYRTLLSRYFNSQENYPSRKSNNHKYIIPYNHKSTSNRISEDGIEGTIKDAKDNFGKYKTDDEKAMYGESKLKVIPLMYNDRIEPENVSLDLAQSILKFDQASKEFKAKIEIEPLLKSLSYAVAENKPVKTDSKGRMIVTKFAEELNLPGLDKYVKKGESNIEALLKYYIDNVLYGVTREKAVYGGIDAHKAVDKLSGVIASTSLGLPFGLFSNVANWLQAEAQTVIEGHSKQFFDNKTYLWAEGEYLRNFNDFIKDCGAPIKTTFIGQMLELYDPFIGEFKDKFGHNISQDRIKNILTNSPTFVLQNLGEHHVQIKSMMAFLKTVKLKDKNGQEVSLYDAYTNLDENGKEGKIRLKEGIDLSQLGRVTANNMLPLSVKNKMNSVLRKTHGNNSNMTAPMMRKYWYGRVIEFMRRFFATSVEKRWRQTRYNFQEEGLTEGYQWTFIRLFLLEFKELYHVGFGFNTNKETNLTEPEIANLRRNAMDIAFVAVTGLLVYILTAMMKNAGDDDEKNRIALFLAPIMRLNAELSAFGQIGDPTKWLLPDIGDIKRNVSNPTVMYGYITKSIHFLEQIPQDMFLLSTTGDIERYQKDTGFWEKGDSKLIAKFLALFGASPSKMDLTESIKTLQMIQNK